MGLVVAFHSEGLTCSPLTLLTALGLRESVTWGFICCRGECWALGQEEQHFSKWTPQKLEPGETTSNVCRESIILLALGTQRVYKTDSLSPL